MKTPIVAALLFSISIPLHAQSAAPVSTTSPAPNSSQTEDTPFAIVAADANSRVWERTTYEQSPSGEIIPHAHRYTELATGMHYWKDGQWVESKEDIEVLPTGGGAATNGQHRVFFPSDIYDGFIELVTSDGTHLKSRPLGICYFDGSNSVFIAELKHSVGQILPSGNQVIYTNAFTGFAADLICTYRVSGFESDLVFREQPPVPEMYGLSSENSQIELLTEFFDTPEPKQLSANATSAPSESGGSLLSSLGTSPDKTLIFGTMTMVQGKAFSVNSGNFGNTRVTPTASRSAENSPPGIKGLLPVSKNWAQIKGRKFLIEAVPVLKMREQLKLLPTSAGLAPLSVAGPTLRRVSPDWLLPEPRISRVNTNAIQLAKVDLSGKLGVVLDYVALNSGQTNFTFQGDTTYFITGPVSLYGNTVIEGGAVIKFTQTNACALSVYSNIICQTGPYRPAIFTSVDDNSVGETISGSTGNPVVDGQNYYLFIFNGLQTDLHDLRMLYCYSGITKFNNPGADLRNIQFVHAAWPVSLYATSVGSSHCSLRNVLMSDVTEVAIEDTAIDIDVENLTINGCVRLGYNEYGAHLSLTNCLLVGVQQMGDIPYSTNCVAILGTNTSVFQTAGAGYCYLRTNSPYRDVGTTNINPVLLAELNRKTTYPPIIYSNITFSANTTFSPQVQRDASLPDIGYHYDPIDYLVDYCWITNAVLSITNGTVTACYNDSGIMVTDGSSIVSVGTPLLPNWFTRYSAVQEQPIALGGAGALPGNADMVNPWHATNAPAGQFRFTKFSCPAGGGSHLYHAQFNWAFSNLLVQDCEFSSGLNYFGGYNSTVTYLKNNLFARSTMNAVGGTYTNNLLSASNNLFWCTATAVRSGQNSNNWRFFNNVFDNSTIATNSAAHQTINGYNAYVGNANRLFPTSIHDIVTNVLTYQIGLLGCYYQSGDSILINSGSTTADLTGLYHFTTQTNQVKEANSVVDIGYHYLAVDSLGNAVDTDGDGIPDYLEDANGNGVVDAGESSWLLNSYNGLSFTSGLQVFTPLK